MKIWIKEYGIRLYLLVIVSLISIVAHICPSCSFAYPQVCWYSDLGLWKFEWIVFEAFVGNSFSNFKSCSQLPFFGFAYPQALVVQWWSRNNIFALWKLEWMNMVFEVFVGNSLISNVAHIRPSCSFSYPQALFVKWLRNNIFALWKFEWMNMVFEVFVSNSFSNFKRYGHFPFVRFCTSILKLCWYSDLGLVTS